MVGVVSLPFRLVRGKEWKCKPLCTHCGFSQRVKAERERPANTHTTVPLVTRVFQESKSQL